MTKNKEVLILALIGLVVIIGVIYGISKSGKSGESTAPQQEVPSQPSVPTPPAGEEGVSQPGAGEEVVPGEGPEVPLPSPEEIPGVTTTPEEGGPVGGEEEGNVISFPGTNTVIKNGVVMTRDGERVDNSEPPGSPKAPHSSAPLTENQIPKDAIRLRVTNTEYSPDSFTVKKGQAVILVITSDDDFTHIFRFKDTQLQGVAVGVGPRETKLIPFNAPEKPGSYEFISEMPGQTAKGVMIVK